MTGDVGDLFVAGASPLLNNDGGSFTFSPSAQRREPACSFICVRCTGSRANACVYVQSRWLSLCGIGSIDWLLSTSGAAATRLALESRSQKLFEFVSCVCVSWHVV